MGKFISYHDGTQALEGYLAAPAEASSLPGVVIEQRPTIPKDVQRTGNGAGQA